MDSRLYDRRKELGLTLEEVGKLAGVSKSTVKKWETGFIENMKRDKIALLAKALQVSPLYIMGADTDESKKYAGPIKKYYETFSQLDESNKKKVIDYTENLLQIQRAEEEQKNAMPKAAHA